MKVKIIISLFLIILVSLCGCQKTVIPKPAPIPIPSDARLVCIFFDDAFENQYEVALPILLEYDFKATFGVITDYVGTGHDLWEYMDTGELEELARHGMDIACHTKTHPDLTTVSDKELDEEIIESKKDLERMGFEVSTMVYPYYAWNEKVIEYVISANFTCARAGWTQKGFFDINNSDPEARYHVTAWQISHQDMDRFKYIVGKAGADAVVCLVYHFISDAGPESTSTPVANFQAQMAYLKNAGFTVIPLPDIFRQ